MSLEAREVCEENERGAETATHLQSDYASDCFPQKVWKKTAYTLYTVSNGPRSFIRTGALYDAEG